MTLNASPKGICTQSFSNRSSNPKDRALQPPSSSLQDNKSNITEGNSMKPKGKKMARGWTPSTPRCPGGIKEKQEMCCLALALSDQSSLKLGSGRMNRPIASGSSNSSHHQAEEEIMSLLLQLLHLSKKKKKAVSCGREEMATNAIFTPKSNLTPCPC